MRTLSLFLLTILAFVGAPLAADDAPPATATLCALAASPLPVDFELHAQCTISVDCGAFPDKSCSNPGESCSGADRNCWIGQAGFVNCGSGNDPCGGPCCGADSVCEYWYGCGCNDPDCASRRECLCIEDGTCNFKSCGCSDPDCAGRPECTPSCTVCSEITDCQSNAECSADCPGSICTSSGICLCAG